jgi:predicted nucleic acid-binding protein
MKVFFDTSVLIAALVQVHPAHALAQPWLQRIKTATARGVLAAHSLAELYSVLSTFPLRPRLTPQAVHDLLRQDVMAQFEVVALTVTDYALTIEQLATAEIKGGVIYDALLLQAAVLAHADQIVTLNAHDFKRVRPDLADKILSP